MRSIRQLLSGTTAFFFVLAPLASLAVDKDVPFVPTDEAVVEVMLKLADVGPKDTLYDLGSGDGRIVIMAAKERGAHGVGVDIDPERIAESRANAKRAGVTDKVQFIEGDLFKVDLRPATAVTLYLLPAVNLKLRPKLLAELRPGTPIVSHDFDMGDWAPETTVKVGNATVYLWHVPARVAGTWRYHVTAPGGKNERHQLQLTQDLDKVRGTVTMDGRSFPVENGRVDGERVMFTVKRPRQGAMVAQRYEGRMVDGRISGVMAADDGGNTGRRLARTDSND